MSILLFEKYTCQRILLSGVRDGLLILVKLKGKTAIRFMPLDGRTFL